MGYRLLMKLSEEVLESGFVEFAPKKEGKSMTMVLGPVLKKSQAAKKPAPKPATKATSVAAAEEVAPQEVAQ